MLKVTGEGMKQRADKRQENRQGNRGLGSKGAEELSWKKTIKKRKRMKDNEEDN